MSISFKTDPSVAIVKRTGPRLRDGPLGVTISGIDMMHLGKGTKVDEYAKMRLEDAIRRDCPDCMECPQRALQSQSDINMDAINFLTYCKLGKGCVCPDEASEIRSVWLDEAADITERDWVKVNLKSAGAKEFLPKKKIVQPNKDLPATTTDSW